MYPYTQWLMIIIPTKWLFHWGYTPFSDIPKYRFIIPIPTTSPYPLGSATFSQDVEGQHAQPAACVNGPPGPLQQGGRGLRHLPKALKNPLRGASCVHGVGLTLVADPRRLYYRCKYIRICIFMYVYTSTYIYISYT